MSRNHPEIRSTRRTLLMISFASNYPRRWSWSDIVTGLVNDANARQYLNPESNDFSSSATRFAIDVANKASEGVGQGKTLTLSLHWLSSHKKDHPSVEPELTTQRFLLDLLLDVVDGNTCQIDMVTFSYVTEHKRGDHIYRAHPDYSKGGPWYDWAYVEFGPDNTGKESHLYPAQIWFFVDFLKPIEISDEYGEGVEDIGHEMTGFNCDGLYAVVTPTDALPVTMVTSNIPTATRTSAAQKAEKKMCTTSLILKTAPWDKKLWLVPVEAISAPAMVLDHPGTHSSNRSSLIVVSPCMEWPDKFLSLKLS
jgi:hypothetical protein